MAQANTSINKKKSKAEIDEWHNQQAEATARKQKMKQMAANAPEDPVQKAARRAFGAYEASYGKSSPIGWRNLADEVRSVMSSKGTARLKGDEANQEQQAYEYAKELLAKKHRISKPKIDILPKVSKRAAVVRNAKLGIN